MYISLKFVDGFFACLVIGLLVTYIILVIKDDLVALRREVDDACDDEGQGRPAEQMAHAREIMEANRDTLSKLAKL